MTTRATSAISSSMPPRSNVAVVVCAYAQERWDDLTRAVSSIGRQTLRPAEVIVVIDHNPELFARATLMLGNVHVIENRHQRGLSGARNSGIEASSADIIAFIDDDAEADPAWLDHLEQAFRVPGVVAAGGTIQPRWDGGRPYWFPDEFNWVVGCTYRGMPTTMARVRNVIGANMAFRRSVLAHAGLFRSGVGRVGASGMGCEETELCIRCCRDVAGAEVLFVPDAVVHHRVSQSRRGPRYFLHRCYSEGKSKAIVARLVGQADGLSSERSYAFRTLPVGFARNLADVAGGKFAGAGRASAIAIGFATTTLGYLIGRISIMRHADDQGPLAQLDSTGLAQSSIG